jgi:hypothetical protein
MSDRITMRRATNQAYLLRLWRDRAEAPLRATLLTVTTPQQHHHFADLDELQSFLVAQTSLPTPSYLHETSHLPAYDQNHCTPDEA